MTIAPPRFEYQPPASAEKVIDNHIILTPEGTCTLYAVAWEYRGKIVDFALTQKADEIRHPQKGEDHVARYDCCHSEVHKHQYYRNGQHFKSGERQERTCIAKIDEQASSWDIVDSGYDVCFDQMTDDWESNYRRWDSDGRNHS